MFSSCALPELGRDSATNVNKLTNFEYASLFSSLRLYHASSEKGPALYQVVHPVWRGGREVRLAQNLCRIILCSREENDVVMNI